MRKDVYCDTRIGDQELDYSLFRLGKWGFFSFCYGIFGRAVLYFFSTFILYFILYFVLYFVYYYI